MIHGIGTDIVSIDRMAQKLSSSKRALAERILSSDELEEFDLYKLQAAFLAKRWAAKEAFVKALGTGFRHGIKYHEIEVQHTELGKPYFYCSGTAQNILDEFSITQVHLSLSDEKNHAVSFVLMEK